LIADRAVARLVTIGCESVDLVTQRDKTVGNSPHHGLLRSQNKSNSMAGGGAMQHIGYEASDARPTPYGLKMIHNSWLHK
jgi:hypothetical protein